MIHNTLYLKITTLNRKRRKITTKTCKTTFNTHHTKLFRYITNKNRAIKHMTKYLSILHNSLLLILNNPCIFTLIMLATSIPCLNAAPSSPYPKPLAHNIASAIATVTVATINILKIPPVPLTIKIIPSHNPNDYITKEVKGDGNCFFRALCQFSSKYDYTDKNDNHLKLRKALITHVLNVYNQPAHPLHETYVEKEILITGDNETIQDTIQRYKNHTSNRGWGGTTDSIFVADLLNLQIIVMEAQQKTQAYIFNPTQPNNETKTAWIYLKDNHWNAMMPKPTTKTNPPQPQPPAKHPLASLTTPTHSLSEYPPLSKPIQIAIPLPNTLNPKSTKINLQQPKNLRNNQPPNLNIMGINIQSINKTLRVNAIESRLQKLNSNPTTKVHILAITETWCKNPKQPHTQIKLSPVLNEYKLYTDAKFTPSPRGQTSDPQEKGRGTALLLSKDLAPYVQNIHKIKGVYTEIELHVSQKKIIVAAIYKPNPNSSRQTALKINEIRKRMASIRNLQEYENHLAVFIGDFNEAPNPQVDRLQASNTPNKSPPRLQQEVDNANSLLHDILDKSSGDIFHPLIDIW
jgi:exonuclease III